MTRVGVAVPSYLGREFIGRTLTSVVEQTYQDWVCVVVNDGDEDGTAEVVREMGDARINYVSDGERRGQFGNCNRALLETLRCGVDVVRLLCHDDMLYPWALADAIRMFEAYPRVGLVTCHYDGIDSDDNLLFKVDMSRFPDRVMSGREYLLKGVAVGNTIGGPSSVAIRRQAIETAGIFDTRMNHSGESDLWHRIAAMWDVAWIGNRPCLCYRIHDQSITGRGKFSVAKFTDPIQIVRRVAANEALMGPRWWVHQYTIGRLHAINLQLIATMAARGRWDGVRAGLEGSMREGLLLYTPFWLPRIPYQAVRLALGLNAVRRVFWRHVHESLQPPRIAVRGEPVRTMPSHASGSSTASDSSVEPRPSSRRQPA